MSFVGQREDVAQQPCQHKKPRLNASGGNCTRRRGRHARSFRLESLENRALLSGVTVQLVKDINTIDAYPAELTTAGTNLFYIVKDSFGTGIDLVVTNTNGSIQVLKDFVPGQPAAGSSNSYPNDPPTGPEDLTAAGNSLYFLASDGTSQDVLWTSDGTAQGTQPVEFSDLNDPGSTVVTQLVDSGGTLFWTTGDPARQQGSNNPYGPDLWSIPPGTAPYLIASNLTSDVSNLTPFVNPTGSTTIFFTVGSDLWESYPISASPVTYYDAATSTYDPIDSVSYIDSIFENVVYYDFFDANTFSDTLSSAAWQPPSTSLYYVGAPNALYTFQPNVSPTNFTAAGSNLFFCASDSADGQELWKTDGTSVGTVIVKDILPGSIGSYPSNLTYDNGTLYFTANDAEGGQQLWKSDGTNQGTTLVTDITTPSAEEYTGGYGSAYSDSPALAVANGLLFFDNSDNTHGNELWETGASGTQMVADIDPGTASSVPHNFAAFNGALYFAAHHGSTPQTNELWESDGTAAGTSLVKSFSPGVTQGSNIPGSTDEAVLGDQMIFTASDGINGDELWVTDGTAAGTSLLADLFTNSLTPFDGEVYFLGTTQADGEGLWKTDGTSAGTVLVKDLTTPNVYSNYDSMTVVGGKLLFNTSDGASGDDLWVSDGTTAGTTILSDFSVTPQQYASFESPVSDLTAAGGKLFFTGDDGIHGSEIWVSDGTTAGTQMLADIIPGSQGSDPSDLTAVGNEVYFFANEENDYVGLWESDGTVAGTSKVLDFAPTTETLPGGSIQMTPQSLSNLTAAGSTLYFSVSSQNGSNYQLWTSNGTAGGTSQINALAPGASFVSMSGFVGLGNLLIFQANDGSHGLEPWVSDGTAEGTTMIEDINPGSGSSVSIGEGTLVYDGILYFAANDGTHGNQLWETDGTAAGTQLLADINPGGSSNPTPLVIKNGVLFLYADDGTHGQELMTATLNQPPTIAPIPAQTVTLTEALTFGVQASEPNFPSETLKYSLASGAPAGASINATTGVFSWAPAATQSPGTYSITVQVANNGVGDLVSTAGFQVTVNAYNVAPSLNPIQNYTVDEGSLLSFSAVATDNDIPAQPISYSLGSGAPVGAAINPTTGAFAWTPTLAQSPGSYSIAVIATNGSPPLSSPAQTFSVLVVAPPTVHAIPTQAVDLGQTLDLSTSNYISDPNTPKLSVSYALGAGAPSGMAINPATGLLTWTPTAAQAPGSFAVTVVATNSASPPLGSQQTFTVHAIAAPLLTAIPSQLVIQGQLLQLSAAGYAFDPNVPPQSLSYSLDPGAPAGASINPSTGLFTWAPLLSVPVGAYSITIRATDMASPPLSAAATFAVNVLYGGPPPTITRTSVSTKRAFTLTLTFSQPMDAGAVDNTFNYQLLLPGKTKKSRGKTIYLTPSYNAATNVVTLTTRTKINLSPVPRLTVLGSTAGGLANTYGTLLGNYVANVSKHSLAQVSSVAAAAARVRLSRDLVIRQTGAPAVSIPVGPPQHVQKVLHHSKR